MRGVRSRRLTSLVPCRSVLQTIQIVCCPLSPLQTACYENVLNSKTTKKLMNCGKELRVLNTIMGACTPHFGDACTLPA